MYKNTVDTCIILDVIRECAVLDRTRAEKSYYSVDICAVYVLFG